MMKKIFLLLLAIFLFFFQKSTAQKGLGDLGEEGFRHLMEREWAREVFDLEEEEAIAVFGEESEVYFL